MLFKKGKTDDLIVDGEGCMGENMQGTHYVEMYLVQSDKNLHPNNLGSTK